MQCEFLGGECENEYTNCPLTTQPEDCPKMPPGGGEEEDPEIPPPGG